MVLNHSIEVEGHQRRTHSGKTVYVKPHSREGNPQQPEPPKEPKPSKITISPEVKEEVNKIVKYATDRNGNLSIEHLRVLAHNKMIQFKDEKKSEQFIKEFKIASKKAEGKIVDVSEHTKFSPNKAEAINIKQYARTRPSDKNKKPEQMTIQDYWKIKKEYVEHIKSQKLTELQTAELINSLPQEVVYQPYPMQRKPNVLIRMILEYRDKLDEKIELMKRKNEEKK